MIQHLMETATTDSLFNTWRKNHHQLKERYQSKKLSYIEDLLPEIAVQLNEYDTLSILNQLLGADTLQKALNEKNTIPSPLKEHKNADWMKTTNMVGVNIRTIGNFFNLIKYAFTLPSYHDSIHILPIWEPGVVGSLYGKVNFNINPEFYSHEFARVVPQLNTVEKQLKATINILHAMGKSVGMDVIPHTDRFSEIVLSYPRFFEWVKRVGGRIINFSESNYREIEEIIWLYLHRKGTANNTPISYSRSVFFSPEIPILSHQQRTEILFGRIEDRQGRLNRRLELMQEILNNGYETLPMTMAPPYRGLHINPEKFVYDESGNKWYDYEFDEPQEMSRVFGPLTRYKFYFNENDTWKLDFSNPQKTAWEFVADQYLQMQKNYGFDFMRGDMAHVQPRSKGVPKKADKYYDPLHFIKKYIQKKGVPYFAFYAETFLAPPDTMGYGDEVKHLEKIEAEATLGDLQATEIDSPVFISRFNEYLKIFKNSSFSPSITTITADKDDPRFDSFYKNGNIIRYFLSLFITDMTSYYSLGFETRNLHEARGKNEEYTKLYVFQIRDENEPDKYTKGSFIWGKNETQFNELLRIRKVAEDLFSEIEGKECKWLHIPKMQAKIAIWTHKKIAKYLFVANLTHETTINEAFLAKYIDDTKYQLLFQSNLSGQDCRIYQLK
jgi:hypothetical protein